MASWVVDPAAARGEGGPLRPVFTLSLLLGALALMTAPAAIGILVLLGVVS